MNGHDPQQLFSRLQGWANEIRIAPHPEVFGCGYYKTCNHSIAGKLHGWRGCQMSYVGSEYGSPENEFRLILVGMDHDFDCVRRRIEEDLLTRRNKFQPDYKGVVRTAAAILGSIGLFCRKNCDKACQGSEGCVLKRIARPNLVKCTPSDQLGSSSRATTQMKINCANHLLCELNILKPDLVVFHGGARETREIVCSALNSQSLDCQPMGPEELTDRHGRVLWKCETFCVLFLNHTSRGWLGRQWATIVEPAVEYLRNEHMIPSNC